MKTAWFLVALLGCRGRHAEPVRLAAAVSLREPLEAELTALRAQGLALQGIYGGSGDLARQVLQGSPIDLLASAAEASLAPLEAAHRAHRRCVLAQNRLVLIRGASARLLRLRWESLAGDPALVHLAIGAAKAVPAGDYAEAALRALGEWESLSPKIVRAGHVRAVLDLVVRGEAEAGVVYATDAAGRSEVVVVGEPPVGAAPDIRYLLDVIDSPDRPADWTARVERVAAALCGPDLQGRLRSAGFLAP